MLTRAVQTALSVLTIVFVSCQIGSAQGGLTGSGESPNLDGCPIFPADNIWNTRIDSLPVHANSAVYLRTIGLSTTLRADFGSGLWDGGPIGIPYATVGSGQAGADVSFDYDDESDPGPYPIPPDPPIEGGRNGDGDRHIIIVDTDARILYELFYAYPDGRGGWTAGSGAIFDLESNDLRPETWTSADAAGLPIFPGLVRYEEIEAGSIDHAIRFTVPDTQRAYLWPARHYASSNTDPHYPPMGLRLRLRADYDISGFSPTNRIILTALKEYGLILADNGAAIFISGAPDERWDNDELRELMRVTAADLEAVDVSSLMVTPDSAAAR